MLGPGNSCDFVHRSSYAGDHPDLAGLLAAATGKMPDGEDFTYPSASYWGARLNVSTRARGGSAAAAATATATATATASNERAGAEATADKSDSVKSDSSKRSAVPPGITAALSFLNLSGTAASIAAFALCLAATKNYLDDAFKAGCFLFLAVVTCTYNVNVSARDVCVCVRI